MNYNFHPEALKGFKEAAQIGKQKYGETKINRFLG